MMHEGRKSPVNKILNERLGFKNEKIKGEDELPGFNYCFHTSSILRSSYKIKSDKNKYT